MLSLLLRNVTYFSLSSLRQVRLQVLREVSVEVARLTPQRLPVYSSCVG